MGVSVTALSYTEGGKAQQSHHENFGFCGHFWPYRSTRGPYSTRTN